MAVHHVPEEPLAAFGSGDGFGRAAERFARFFGTSRFLVGQTALIVVWIAVNAGLLAAARFDPFPFILLNLLFSTQAAYAAPLILLAQNRQAVRDKVLADADAAHREEIAREHQEVLDAIHDLVRDDTPGGVRTVIDRIDELEAGRGR